MKGVIFTAPTNRRVGLLRLPVPETYEEYPWPCTQRHTRNFMVVRNSLNDSLIPVGPVVHIIVRSHLPSSSFPSHAYETAFGDTLAKRYHAMLKLCHFVEKSIQSAVKHCYTSYSMRHDICWHSGDEHCCRGGTFKNG